MRTTLSLILALAAICIWLATALRTSTRNASAGNPGATHATPHTAATNPSGSPDGLVAALVEARDACGTNYQRYLYRASHLCGAAFRDHQTWEEITSSLQRQGLREAGSRPDCVGDETWTTRDWPVTQAATSSSEGASVELHLWFQVGASAVEDGRPTYEMEDMHPYLVAPVHQRKPITSAYGHGTALTQFIGKAIDERGPAFVQRWDHIEMEYQQKPAPGSGAFFGPAPPRSYGFMLHAKLPDGNYSWTGWADSGYDRFEQHPRESANPTTLPSADSIGPVGSLFATWD